MADGSTGTWFAQPQALASRGAEFARFRLRLQRGAIRAWHTTMLAIAAIGQVLDLLLPHVGTAMALMPWSHGYHFHGPEYVVVVCSAVALLVRCVLCAVSWSRSFELLYPRIAPVLVLIGNAGATVAFSYPVYSGRQGYVVLVSLQVFAAAMLSGLSFRQSVYANAATMIALVLVAWTLAVPLTTAVSIIYAILLCCFMSGFAGWALENSSRRLFREHSHINDLAMLDGLTGLKNRHAFNTYLPRACQDAVEGGHALTLLLVDVDFFKSYNDTRGHIAGDQALQQIAHAIQDAMHRHTDFVARYGGDEIAVILLGVTTDRVIRLTTRMHEAVNRLGLTLQDGEQSRWVTLSTGVAHLRPPLHPAALTALQVADQALYAAKRAGRNRFALLTEAADTGAADVFEPGRLQIA